MEAAKKLLDSNDENERAVAKAVIDVTAETIKVQQAVAAKGKVNLAPYFDFWFGDALASANALLKSTDENTHYLARCLIDQEKSINESKESFLLEMKRLGVKPNN